MRRLVSVLGPILLLGVFAVAACDKKADPPANEPVAVDNAQLANEGEGAPAADEGTPTQADEAVAAAGASAKGCACKGGEGCTNTDCAGEGKCDCADKGCCEGKAGCGDKADHAHAHGDKAAGCCGGAAKTADHAHDHAHEGCGGHDPAHAAAVAPEPVVAAAPAHEGCGHAHDGAHAHAAAPAEPAAAPETDEAGTRHFGEAFTLTAPKPLGEVISSSPDGLDEVVLVSGTIHEVCQTKGCWMVVRDGEREARVVMKGYSFFVPKDAKGKSTRVEGTLQVKDVTEAHAKHLAEDAGKDPSTVTGDRKEYVVTASGIAIGG